MRRALRSLACRLGLHERYPADDPKHLCGTGPSPTARPTFPACCRHCNTVRLWPSPQARSSSWRYVSPSDTRESIEAWRAGTAGTAPVALSVTAAGYTPQSGATSSTTAEITPEYAYRVGASS